MCFQMKARSCALCKNAYLMTFGSVSTQSREASSSYKKTMACSNPRIRNANRGEKKDAMGLSQERTIIIFDFGSQYKINKSPCKKTQTCIHLLKAHATQRTKHGDQGKGCLTANATASTDTQRSAEKERINPVCISCQHP